MGVDPAYFFEFGEFQLHPVERQLLSSGKVIPLTPKAFDTLCTLVEQKGHLLEKDRLMELLWADAFVEEGNLADNISKIRHALGDSRKQPKFIETVSGRGYRFIAKVEKIESGSNQVLPGNSEVTPTDPIATETTDPTPRNEESAAFFQASVGDYFSPHQIPSSLEPSQPPVELDSFDMNPATTISPLVKTRFYSRRVFKAALAVVLIGSMFFYYWNQDQTQTVSPPSGNKSIAVLPFKPLAAIDRDEALELGMSDSLISALGRLRRITVRPISAVRRYSGLEQDAVAAGRELRVESVLEGNIQRADERIRITARLFRVEDGAILWSETFDEKFTDIFAVQDSIAQKITGALAVKLTGGERSDLLQKYTVNTEAYQLYLRGRFFWTKVTPEGLQRSLDLYSQAIDLDPNYALAYAGLADSYNLLGSYGFWPMSESHPKARAAAEKALDLDDSLAEAHTSLATVIADYYWDWDAAERHFNRAIELNPNYPIARYWHSQHLSRLGRHDEAIEEAKRALAMDPLSSSAAAHVGLALYRARRFDEAEAELRKLLEFDTEAMDAHIFLGFVYLQQGRGEDAIGQFQDVVRLSNRNPSMLALLAYGYASAGRRSEAVAIMNEFNSETGGRPASSLEKAMIHIALGESDAAFDWLGKACDERAWQLGFLNVDPIFDPLRSDPRFADLMRRLNLPVTFSQSTDLESRHRWMMFFEITALPPRTSS